VRDPWWSDPLPFPSYPSSSRIRVRVDGESDLEWREVGEAVVVETEKKVVTEPERCRWGRCYHAYQWISVGGGDGAES
jgi:hypothetical protein